MKICIVDPFPARSYSWERQFAAHLSSALERLGHSAETVRCSDEIYACDPHAVVATHEAIAKLTHHYTIGFAWNDLEDAARDRAKQSAIRSWDLAVPADRKARRFVKDLHFPMRTAGTLSAADHHPTAMPTALDPADPARLRLVRIGAFSGLRREKHILEALADVVDLSVYGPEADWAFLAGRGYRGPLPTEPAAILDLLNRHGAAFIPTGLIEADGERPSLHFFEACAAKCLIFTGPIEAVSTPFGDSLHYIDPKAEPAEVAGAIRDALQASSAEPRAFRDRVAACSAVHRERFSLEALAAELVAHAGRHALAASARPRAREDDPSVSVIIRCGDRPLSFIERAVASVRAQRYARVGLIIVSYALPPGFEGWLERLEGDARFVSVRHIRCPRTGVRSETLWAGFRAVDTDLFCNLDDDDELFPNHIGDLVSTLSSRPEVALAYTASIRHEEDGLLLDHGDRFKGDLDIVVAETRELCKFEDFDVSRLLDFDCIISSNAWMARRTALYPELMEDPDLEVAEDLYFFLLLAHRHRIAFSGTASAIYNFRTRSRDNTSIAVSQEIWEDCMERIGRRLSRLVYPLTHPGVTAINFAGDVVARGEAAPAAAVDYGDLEIVFASPSVPGCVRYWTGLSGAEAWGRWTDGKEVKIAFHEALPPRFTLRIHGYAFEQNRYSPILIAIGNRAFALHMDEYNVAKTYDVDVENDEGRKVLYLAVPHPTRPIDVEAIQSSDTRQLGIALSWLEIKARSG